MPDTAIPAATHGGTAHATQADFALARARAARIELDALGVIEAGGADAASFLQGQLTNDTVHLPADRVQRTGYCTAKGRLIATFDQWRDGEAIALQLPREILAPVMKRLSMFVLRARAVLRDASAEWRTAAVLGPGSGAALCEAGLPVPPHGATRRAGRALVSHAPSPAFAERYVVRAPADAACWPSLAALPATGDGVWWWSEVDSGVPTVFAATQERFVPQMINFEVLGGVNFKKGCYPGQEVVARSQYLGKLRRRMGIAHLDGDAAAALDVFAAGEAEAVGVIVMAAAAPDGGSDVLFECAVDKVAGLALHAGAPGGPALRPRALPYAIVDVTA